jgi:glycosyltransferase involved in cell wall biosynthesis
MNPAPLVSVITPAFNAAATLRRAHDSVRAQRANWEHIIVDDGSTDGTAEVIASLADYSRVVSASRANGGPGAALNTGLKLARGEYIAFLDADDEYGPDHLESHVSLLEGQHSIDILWGGAEVLAGSPEDALVPDVVRGYGFVAISDCVVQGTIFARSKVFEKLKFSEDRAVWYQDYDFIARARECFVVEKFPVKTYKYHREHGTGIVEAAKKSWPKL